MIKTIDGQYVYDPGDIFTAKNDAYTFCISDVFWLIDFKEYINFSTLEKCNFSDDLKKEIRVLIAYYAVYSSPGTAQKRLSSILHLSISPEAMIIEWASLSPSIQIGLKSALKKTVLLKLDLLRKFYQEIKSFDNAKVKSNCFNVNEGTYSNVEYSSLQSEFKKLTNSYLTAPYVEYVYQSKTESRLNFLELRSLVCNLLMWSLMRRPIQLYKMKWSDILPVGFLFGDFIHDSKAILYSDSDELQCRTFRGKDKNSKFRSQAEPHAHRIDSELTKLIILYRNLYQKFFIKHLERQGIRLNQPEIHEIMSRLPVFPEGALFSDNFVCVKTVFKTISRYTPAYHVKASTLHENCKNIQLQMAFKSERISGDKLFFSNNRHRHTVMTNGVLNGYSYELLASIAGVTIDAVTHYVDLNYSARLQIDEAFAKHDILQRFGRISVSQLRTEKYSIYTNEFDEEVAQIESYRPCSSCEKKIARPLGCYSCSNFRPLPDADHERYLRIAEERYKTELKHEASNQVIGRFKIIIAYIKATIKVCRESKVRMIDEVNNVNNK